MHPPLPWESRFQPKGNKLRCRLPGGLFAGPAPSDAGRGGGGWLAAQSSGSAREDARCSPRSGGKPDSWGGRGHPTPGEGEGAQSHQPLGPCLCPPSRPSSARESPPEVRERPRSASGTLGRSGHLSQRCSSQYCTDTPATTRSRSGSEPQRLQRASRDQLRANAPPATTSSMSPLRMRTAAGQRLARSDSRMRRSFRAIPGRGPESLGGGLSRPAAHCEAPPHPSSTRTTRGRTARSHHS